MVSLCAIDFGEVISEVTLPVSAQLIVQRFVVG